MAKIFLLEAKLSVNNKYVEREEEWTIDKEMPKTYYCSAIYDNGYVVKGKRILKSELNEVQCRYSTSFYVFITDGENKDAWFKKMRQRVFNVVSTEYNKEKVRMDAMNEIMGVNKREITAPEIKQLYVLTNGQPSQSTLDNYVNKGYLPLSIAQAKQFHPSALDTDAIVFFAKPIDKAEYDKWRESYADESSVTMEQTPHE